MTQINILKNASQIFSHYKFWKSFVFSAETVIKSGHRRNHLSAILLVFLGFPDLIQWQNTWARIANPTWVFLDHPNITHRLTTGSRAWEELLRGEGKLSEATLILVTISDLVGTDISFLREVGPTSSELILCVVYHVNQISSKFVLASC